MEFSDLFAISCNKNFTVGEMYDFDAPGFKWKLTFSRLVAGNALVQLCCIFDLLENVSLSNEYDDFVWMLEGERKLFSVRSLYKLINFAGTKGLVF